jgi:hypothetical protein
MSSITLRREVKVFGKKKAQPKPGLVSIDG